MGIKMTSNANDAMELNDVHVEAKIVIYHTPKTELRLRRYEQSKLARKNKGGRESQPDLGFPDLAVTVAAL